MLRTLPFSQRNDQSKLEDSRVQLLNTSLYSFPLEHQPSLIEQTDIKKTEVPESILNILARPYEERSSIENSSIAKYLTRLRIFRTLSDKLSPEVVKQLLRLGRLIHHPEGQILAVEGRKLKTVHVLITGSVLVYRNAFYTETPPEENDLCVTLDLLIQKFGREVKNFKLRSQGLNKKLTIEAQSLEDIRGDSLTQIAGESLLQSKLLLDYEPRYDCSYVTKEATITFNISLEDFYSGLLQTYNGHMQQLIRLFRKVPVFAPFQNSKLKFLIERLHIVEYKRGNYIYQEGDTANCFYLLTEGQVQISRSIQVFAENPNSLYRSRTHVSRQKGRDDIQTLPYANFDGVYSYQPEKQLVSLCLLSPICIFGQEQLVGHSPRQVNAKICSLNAKLYQIMIEDIEELCSRTAGPGGQSRMGLVDFLAVMQESVTLKKILFRQKQLSDMVNHQNRSKYPSLFQNQPKPHSKSLRKKTITYKPSKSLFLPDEESPPTFNNFNFTDFMKDPEQEQDYDLNILGTFSGEEEKVIQLTHLKYNSPIKPDHPDRTIRLRNHSKQLSRKMDMNNLATISSESADLMSSMPKVQRRPSQSHTITLENPLFNLSYFQHQQRQQRKLYVEAKKKKLQTIYKNSPERNHR